MAEEEKVVDHYIARIPYTVEVPDMPDDEQEDESEEEVASGD